VPVPGLGHRRGEVRQLYLPPHEGAEASRGRQLEPGADWPGAGQLVDRHGGSEPLDGDGAERLRRDISLGKPQGVLGDEDLAGRRELFHARRQMRHLADRRVVHAQVATHRAHDDLARVQAHADLHGEAMPLTQLFGQRDDAVLHSESRVARADRVVLVGQGRAEEGHDAVAHHLVHGAFVVMDGVHHQREDGVEKLARLLGVAVCEELHGALEVGKEDGDLLALAFQGGLGGENFLGEVLGGVRPR
jgi:hypothetical protein